MISYERIYCYDLDGTGRNITTYYGKSTDTTANGDGTYSVNGVSGLNADRFLAMDTCLLLMCDGETGKWHKQ